MIEQPITGVVARSNPAEMLEFLRGDGDMMAVTHFFPDGDAVGSLAAIGLICEQLGRKCELWIDDYCPEKYDFIPGYENIRNFKIDPVDRVYPRVVVLDAGALPRIGGLLSCIGPHTALMNIDHHYTGSLYGQLNHVDINACATCEIIYDLCQVWGVEITPQIATALFVGILTDTGRFRFTNTTARSLRICSELINGGADPCLITERIFFNYALDFAKALSRGLASLELHQDGLVSLMTLNFDHYHDDTEGFVEYASSIKGVVLAAFISEMEPGLFKVSLRSRCSVDVSEVARRLKGGGHRKAAGLRFRGSYDVLKQRLLSEMKREIELIGISASDSLCSGAIGDSGRLSPEGG